VGVDITRRDHTQAFKKPTTQTHQFQLKPFQGYVIEVEDVHFHHNSAVFLADYGAFTTPVDEDSERVVGLCTVRACYQQAASHPQQKLLLAGHTDTTGSAAYNLPLSRKRASNFLAVLSGDRDSWVPICVGQHKTEDYQQILKWVAYLWGWPCDPGIVDNVLGLKTTAAIKAFQAQYNQEYEKTIAEDGIVGEETWGAFFDVYMCVLEDILNTDEAGLIAMRSALNFLGPQTVGCGEEFPIEAPRRNEYRSKINRRIECLFFDPGQEPQFDCHPSTTVCTPINCEIYNPKMYKFTHIPVPPTKYHRKFRVTVEYGDIDSLFTDIAANSHTDAGVRERLQAVGFLYEPLDSANIGQIAHDAWDHFKTATSQATDDAAVAQLKTLVQNTIVDQNKLPAPGAFSKVRLPGTYCVTDAQYNAGFFGNPAAAGATSYHYQSETALWSKNPSVGLIPIIAKVEMRRACKYFPSGAGVRVHFQLIKPDDIPAGSDVAATPLRSTPATGSVNRSRIPPRTTFTFNMTGHPNKYVTDEKKRNAVVADDPQVDNAHQSVGGKRGNAVPGADKLKNLLEITTTHPGFQGELNLNAPAASAHPNAVVVETNDDSKAGVIVMPAWTGGDRYKIRAFLDPMGGQAWDGTENDAAKYDTGTLVVWRILRFSKYLRWAYPAGTPAATKAALYGELPTFDIAGVIAGEYKKSWFDVTVEPGASAPNNISQADWTSAVRLAKANCSALALSLAPAYDINALLSETTLSFGFMNFLTAAQYDAAPKGAPPPGGWLSAVADPAYWANMTTLFHAVDAQMMQWFTKNAIGGVTVIQTPSMCSLSLDPNAPSPPFGNSGWGTSKRGCYVIFGQNAYTGATAWMPYDHNRNTLHETGHVTYGVHQYTLVEQVNASTGGIYDEHDYHDLCIMGYMKCSGGFCGRCTLNHGGWNTRAMPANNPGP